MRAETVVFQTATKPARNPLAAILVGQTRIIFILFLTIQLVCRGQDSSYIQTDPKRFYFPIEVFRDTSAQNHQDFKNKWYSKQLFAMKEPILYLDTIQKEIYRFTWLRTFHNPIAIRIEKQGDIYLLFWKLCNGAGGYNPGDLTINKQKNIDKATWDKFMELITRTAFWTTPPLDPNHGGFDGAQWILEGKSAKQYHVVDRWSPSANDNFNKCCNFLIHLTDLKIKESNKY